MCAWWPAGGCDDTLQAHANNRLLVMISGDGGDIYEYNLIVVGGGSGGLAVAKVVLFYHLSVFDS